MTGGGIEGFDQAFGKFKNELCVIYGPAGSGKTTLAKLACIAVARNNKNAIFLDAEQSFSVNRFKQLAGIDASDLLERVFVVKVRSFQEQSQNVNSLVKIAKNFNLVVLDTIGVHFRNEYKNDVYRFQQELERQMRILNEISRSVPVIITNQVYSNMRGSVNMIGSDQVRKWCSQIVRLEKDPRKLFQEKPELVERSFEILDSGIKFQK